MRMNKVLDQVSYQLMLHDLNTNTPFKKPSPLLLDLNPSARAHAKEVYLEKYQKNQSLILTNKDQNGLYDVLKSMGYDAESH